MEYPYFSTITNTLKSVKRPGGYATGGVRSMPLPSLSMSSEPNVILGLPLGNSQVKSFIGLSTRAPFGRGEETIVDTSVHCTWQLSPQQFFINNTEWSKELKTLLEEVKADLGCHDNMTVTCELYKLLLYEPGGFFKVSRIV